MDKSDKKTVGFDASTFAGALFRPHGMYSEQTEGQIVHSHFTGPFNFEMFAEFQKLMRISMTEAKLGGRFVLLAEFHVSMMTSQDVIIKLTETLTKIAQEMPELIGVAHVAAQSVEGRGVMARVFKERIYLPIGTPYQMFDDLDTAKNWLHGLLSDAA